MAGATTVGEQDYAARVIEAARDGARIPAASTSMPAITIAASYRIQGVLVAAALDCGDTIAGYKGGLVTPGLIMGGKPVAPALGVLLRSGEMAPAATISLAGFRQLVIECEIAFTFGHGISTQLGDVAALRAAVRAVRPAIELPDFALDGAIRTPADLIAINVAVSRHMLGRPVPATTPLGDVTPTLARDGETIATGDVAATVGDPWATLLALVNLAVDLGHRIEAGNTILSGAIIVVFDPQPGTYVADFGALGTIDLTVTA